MSRARMQQKRRQTTTLHTIRRSVEGAKVYADVGRVAANSDNNAGQ